ncbi:acyl-CoA dehydrogenase [Phenylobacterium zucineum HLK1]|uniref:Acyl-CoA dehydrogenase n=1 Tax=Phenylobacterium zucineum (strain HLK1) TaxID=450851 RepID=B4RH02_PHEZH|nr:acyl-CoA dehydrogenase family protein [Phenylobacterium zucineum]ACG78950.1 acyl-CoA dehydrogenase [Phenylobacterium zucineum HLK1]
MDLTLGEEYDAFREEVLQFLAEAWPPRQPSGDEAADAKAFRRLATERGLLYRRFPREYGGSGQAPDPLKDRIVREEFARRGAPGELAGIGQKMLAPTLLARGEEWQKRRFIAPTLAGDLVWCQGYSEPGSGSDLASLRTRAVLDGDAWVIAGQKIWTSDARAADYMFILVRTEPDAPKHAGISYLLLDMKAPGITIRPLKQMNGEAHFNEVFFDEVRTPADWIVGKRGEGWSVARTTLSFERASVNAPEAMDDLLRRVKDQARTARRNGRPLIEDPVFRDELARVEGYAMAHRYSVLRQMSMDTVGQDPGLAGLCNKLVGTDVGLKIARLFQEAAGDAGLLMPGPGVTRDDMDAMFWIMRSMSVTIAGGTSNIQRNIIAERGLGLPRDPGS